MNAELIAVVLAVHDDTPMVRTLEEGRSLPSGPLRTTHASLQKGVRDWVEQKTGFHLGHVEQLYTFVDPPCTDGTRVTRISYMALTRVGADTERWKSWYDYLPWEDRKTTVSSPMVNVLEEKLLGWAGRDHLRQQRCAFNFGLGGMAWDDELVLQRYELMWEAGLVPEAPHFVGGVNFGRSMTSNSRRILATSIARLRAKIKYRPLVFELLPEIFTLWELQRTVEAIAGRAVHKQNFRRLILHQNLVEKTTGLSAASKGRPAQLFRFRRELVGSRRFMGSKLPLVKSS